jgi:hypothetical protein
MMTMMIRLRVVSSHQLPEDFAVVYSLRLT